MLAKVAHPVAALVGVTAISGAFVAGLHAGLCYNTWPDMDGSFLPPDYFEIKGGWVRPFTSAGRAGGCLLALLHCLLTCLQLQFPASRNESR